ncbi:hypothetical protein LIER_11847 [Lithospermum erythrorhizon]|uniref:Uncharacterized protein n=1 Tax=Lithospermum erythrorhizon TaxID=34254 RepID=A0AAV3PTX6_LITER
MPQHKKVPAKQSRHEGAKPTKQAKGKRQLKRKRKSTEPVKQPKRKAKEPIKQPKREAKNGETSVEDPFAERRRETDARRGKIVGAKRGGNAFKAPKPTPIAWVDHNEDDGNVEILSLPEKPQNDSNVQILKVVKDTIIDRSVSQRETKRVKRAMVKYKSKQAKKKGRKE